MLNKISDSTPTETRDARVWGDRLLAILSLLLFSQFAVAWIRQYENPEGNAALLNVISFRVIDPPWMPFDVPPTENLISLHHFGDLMLAMGFGLTNNPYLVELPSQTLPIGHIFFRFLASWGYYPGLWIFIVLSLGAICFTSWTVLKHLTISQRIVFTILTCGLSLGTVTSLDRGALALFCIGAIGISFILANKNHAIWASIILIVVISIKPYCVILLFYPLLKGKLKFAMLTMVSAFIFNIVYMSTLPGGLVLSIQGFLKGMSRYSGDTGEFAGITLGSSGLFGATNRLISIFVGPVASSEIMGHFLTFALPAGALILLIICILVASANIPYWASLPLLLSATMFVVPSSMIYTTSWASLAAIYFAAEPKAIPWSGKEPANKLSILLSRIEIRPPMETFVRYLILATIVINLVPWFATHTMQNGVVDPWAYSFPGWSIMVTLPLIVLSLRIRETKKPLNQQ